jgi:cytochrome c556
MTLFSETSHGGKLGRGIMLSLAVLAGTVAVHEKSKAQDNGGDPVLDRQLVMQQLEKDSGMMGKVLAGIESKDKLSATADALAKDAKEVRDSFQSKTPGGRTKPEAWANWEDFSKRLDDMVAKTEHMAEVAKTGNVNGVNELVADAIPCRGCHTAYRAPKT